MVCTMKITFYHHAIRHRFNEPTKAQKRVVEGEVVKEKIASDYWFVWKRLSLLSSTSLARGCGPNQIKNNNNNKSCGPSITTQNWIWIFLYRITRQYCFGTPKPKPRALLLKLINPLIFFFFFFLFLIYYYFIHSLSLPCLTVKA